MAMKKQTKYLLGAAALGGLYLAWKRGVFARPAAALPAMKTAALPAVASSSTLAGTVFDGHSLTSWGRNGSLS